MWSTTTESVHIAHWRLIRLTGDHRSLLTSRAGSSADPCSEASITSTNGRPEFCSPTGFEGRNYHRRKEAIVGPEFSNQAPRLRLRRCLAPVWNQVPPRLAAVDIRIPETEYEARLMMRGPAQRPERASPGERSFSPLLFRIACFTIGLVEASSNDRCNATVRNAEFGLGGVDLISQTLHEPAPLKGLQALRGANDGDVNERCEFRCSPIPVVRIQVAQDQKVFVGQVVLTHQGS